MPGGDRTGPVGMGPMTGRAAGFCAGYPMPGYANPVGGRGMGMGWGRGRGRGFGRGLGLRHGGYAANAWDMPYSAAMPFAQGVTAEQEIADLKAQAQYLANSLSAIKQRIEEIQGQQEQSSPKE